MIFFVACSSGQNNAASSEREVVEEQVLALEPQRVEEILLVTVDTLRADRVGAYGDSKAQTPHIDRLAAEGVLFREAYSVVPLTLPAHASILTGLLPQHHHLRDNAGFALPETVTTLPEKLQEAGYQTAAFVSAYVLHPAWGLDQGFSFYPDPFHPADVSQVAAFGEAEIPSADVANAALDWWRETEGAKFLWLHLYEPHAPWDAPRGWSGDPYRGEVAEVDLILRRIFSEVSNEGLIVLTSDHGEGLWSEGEREHGVYLHEAVARVPLIIRPPGGVSSSAEGAPREKVGNVQRPEGVDLELDLEPVPDHPKAGRIVEEFVSLIDIAPTIAAYAGVEFKAEGRSLYEVVQGEEKVSGPIYMETLVPWFHYGWQPLRLAKQQDLELLRGGRDTWKGEGSEEEKAALSAWLDGSFGDLPAAPGVIDLETEQALMALGYMSSSVSVELESAPDPRDQHELFLELQGLHLLPKEQAILRLESIWRKEPQLISVAIDLSLRYAEMGELKKALEVSEHLLEQQPHQTTALLNAGLLSLKLGAVDAAMSHAEVLIQLNPKDPRGYRLKTAIFVEQNSSASVLEWGLKGIAIAPKDPNLHYLVALAFLFEEQPAKALEYLDKASIFGSRSTDTSLWKGVSYERLGEVDKAKEAYAQAARLLKGDLRPMVMSGLMLAEAGRCEEAKPLLINAGKRGAAHSPALQKAIQICGGL